MYIMFSTRYFTTRWDYRDFGNIHDLSNRYNHNYNGRNDRYHIACEWYEINLIVCTKISLPVPPNFYFLSDAVLRGHCPLVILLAR